MNKNKRGKEKLRKERERKKVGRSGRRDSKGRKKNKGKVKTGRNNREIKWEKKRMRQWEDENKCCKEIRKKENRKWSEWEL